MFSKNKIKNWDQSYWFVTLSSGKIWSNCDWEELEIAFLCFMFLEVSCFAVKDEPVYQCFSTFFPIPPYRGRAPSHQRPLKVWGRSPQPPDAGSKALSRQMQKGLGDFSNAGRFFQFLNKITHFYVYFGQNSYRYFTVINYQLKAFEKQSKLSK